MIAVFLKKLLHGVSHNVTIESKVSTHILLRQEVKKISTQAEIKSGAQKSTHSEIVTLSLCMAPDLQAGNVCCLSLDEEDEKVGSGLSQLLEDILVTYQPVNAAHIEPTSDFYSLLKVLTLER